MKITFPMFGLGWSGGERIIANLSNELVRRGHEVAIVVPKNNYLGLYPLKAEIIRALPLKTIPYLEILNGIVSLASKVPKSDIVCANWCLTVPPTLISANLFKKGIPFYFAQHCEYLFFPKWYLGYPYFVKNTYRHFNNIIAESNWIAENIFKISKKKPVVINPGIEHDLFYPRKKTKGKKTKIILSIGREEFWKGNRDLAKAMEIVYKKEKNIKLVFAGKLKPKISAKIPYEYKAVEHDKLPELYSNADIFVQSSWYEGFGQTPLEAMACATPVITTDCGGSRDYAVNNRNCLVVPPRNPALMAEAILKLINNAELQKKLIKEGIKTAKKFTYKKMADEFEKAFSDALK